MSNDSPVAVLYDGEGNPVTLVSDGGSPAKYSLGAAVVQNVKTSVGNSSTTNLAAGASFTGTYISTYGVAGIQVNVKCDQPVRVSVQQSTDHSNWDIADEYDLPAGEGDGRTTQATPEYLRVVVTNLGPVLSTYFRLQTVLCPIVEALPRALTPQGRLSLSSSGMGFLPDPTNFSDRGQRRALLLDSERNLRIRGTILTDELSFRDDFTGTDLHTTLTGTCYFRTGETHVVGVGTSFLSEVKIGQHLHLSTDPESDAGVVLDVYSDTDLVLEEGYTGATGNGSGLLADWESIIGTGASESMASSELALVSGTTIYSAAMIYRAADYLPFILRFRVKYSQRIANQAAMVGFMDNSIPASANGQAYVQFDGTDNTKVTLVSGTASTSLEQTTVTLPNLGTTATYHDYLLQVSNEGVTLWVDGILLVTHIVHIPGPYQELGVYAGMFNYGVPATSSTFTLDHVSLANYDKLDIGVNSQGAALPVQTFRSAITAVTSPVAAVADTLVLAANVNRLGATIYNDSTALLYLKLGTGASLTSFTVRIAARGYYEVPFNYTGLVHGYWSVATGAARVTELT